MGNCPHFDDLCAICAKRYGNHYADRCYPTRLGEIYDGPRFVPKHARSTESDESREASGLQEITTNE